ncbi:MAG: hypothetical protein G01um101444_379 [Parcubacteria group bacterium Gr01-1014_44]|nr:MAG: hypothetical protein G01um101444_379 [Parcubacteria group bacterium Gr01-1014_44]
MPEELETTEEDVSTQLAAQQEFNLANQQFNSAVEEGQQYGRPSFLKYGFLFAVAGVMDIVDVADVTGVGIIISKVVSIGGTAIIYGVLWLTNGKVKKAQQYGDNLAASVATFQAQTARAERMVLRASKTLGKIPGLKGLAGKIPANLGKLKGIIKKSPLTKILIGGGINLIPFVAVINLMVFWIYMSYRDEKNTYRQAREAASEAIEQTQTA